MLKSEAIARRKVAVAILTQLSHSRAGCCHVTTIFVEPSFGIQLASTSGTEHFHEKTSSDNKNLQNVQEFYRSMGLPSGL